MINKIFRFTCDLCGYTEMVDDNNPPSDDWMDLIFDERDTWKYKNQYPSMVCPACSEKLKRVIYEIRTSAMTSQRPMPEVQCHAD